VSSFKLFKKYWLVFILSVMILVWFSLFKLRSIYIWNIQAIIIEGIFLFALLVGYVYIRRLRIRNLDLGWGMLSTGMLIHLLGRFTYQPNVISIEIRSIVLLFGLVLTADGFYRAFTRVKEIKQVLRESEERYRTVLNSSPSGIYIFQDEKFVFVNEAMEYLSGYKREELLSMNYLELIPLDYRDEMERMTKQALTGNISGLPLKHEFRAIRRDGKKRWVENTPTIIEYKGRPAILGNVNDVTERKRGEERIQDMSALYRKLGKAVNRSQSISELSKRILRALNETIDYDMGNISIYDAGKNVLIESAQIGYSKELNEVSLKKEEIKEGGRGVATFSALHRRSIYIDNMKEHKLTRYIHNLCEKLDLKEMYTIPLITRGNLQGVLQIIVRSDKTLSREDRELFDIVSEEIAAGMAKIKAEEELRNLVIRDYLTGLYNHRHFYQRLGEEKSRSERYGEVYSLLYLDIDDFKTCNDTYGHLEGDRVLQVLGKILQNHLRKADSAYRYGGEEFVALLPRTYKEQAKWVAERIHREVHRKLYPGYKVTVSIGIADSRTDEDVVVAADRAMYEAKREGKNRIKIALP